MDGSVWEFTREEYDALPRYAPAHEPETGVPVGLQQAVWYLNGLIYVVFTKPGTFNPYSYEEPIE